MIHIITILSQAIAKVRAALNGHNGCRMDDLEMMLEFTHTGDLGSYFLKSDIVVEI